jgi:MFS family permease
MGLRETLPDPQKIHPRLLRLPLFEIIETKALPIALVTGLIYMTFGVLLTISPDQAEYVGMTNKGLLFTSFTFFAILSRAVAGKISDRRGRISVIKFGIILLVASLILSGTATSAFQLMVAAGALGFSTGVAAPAVFAWVIDISPEDRRGRYMATVYIALEIGIGFGALFSSWIYANNSDHFGRAYFAVAGLTTFAWIYLQFYKRGE